MKTTEQAKPQAAEQQDRPNNQDGPNYGPLTEKEHLRAIKLAEEEALAAIYDRYKAAKNALPPEPDDRPMLFGFSSWLNKAHPDIYAKYERITSASYRKEYEKDVTDALFDKWAEEEGRELAQACLQWERQRDAIEADYKATRAPHEAAIDAARKRWDEIQRDEERERIYRMKIDRRKAELREAIGFELCRDIDLKHPDFDRATYEKYMAWDSWPDDAGSPRNAILGGPPRIGKTRALAARAFVSVGPDEEENRIEWITAAKYADLITSLGNNEERDAARRHLRRLAEAELLFFDDLGSVHFTDARISHFMALVDARYQKGFETHFTTNFTLAQIREMLSGRGAAADVMLADRILGRIIGTEAEPRAEVFQFKRRKAPAAKGRKDAAVC
jgi:DNA replication protein DnaC